MPLYRIVVSCLILLLAAALVSVPAQASAVFAATATPPPASAGMELMTVSNLSGWYVSTALNQRRYMHAMTAWQNVLYVLGGSDMNLCQGDMEYAVIQKDGVLAKWLPVSTPPAEQTAGFDLTRCFFKAVTTERSLYLLGGVNAQNSPIQSVAMATILPWGDLSGWQSALPLPAPRINFGAAAANGVIYIAGGTNGANALPLNSVLYARVLPDGSLDAWTATEPLHTARNGLELLAVNGYLYAVGGNGGSGSSGAVEYARINTDGSLSPWQSTNTLTTPRTYFGAASDGEYIYVMGGAVKQSNESSSSVEYAHINKDHSLTRWRATRNLLQDKIGPAAAAVNGYLYVTGGMAYDNTFHTTEYTQALVNGPVLQATVMPSPTPTTTPLPSATSTITLTPTITPTATATATFDPFLIYTQAAQTVQAALAQTAQAATATASAAAASAETDTPTLSPTATATTPVSPTETITPAPSLTTTPPPTAVSPTHIEKNDLPWWGWTGLAVLVVFTAYLYLRLRFRGRRLVINLGRNGRGHHFPPPTDR